MRFTITTRLVTQPTRRVSVLVVTVSAAALAGCVNCDDANDPWATVVAYNGEPATGDIFHGSRRDFGSWGHGSWGQGMWGHDISRDSDPGTAAAEAQQPDCTVKSVVKPAPGKAGSTADPNLVEVARLELERDCYKRAEEAARRRLEAAPAR